MELEHNGAPLGPPDLNGLSLQRDAWGRLVLVDAEGHRHVGVEPVRAFPLTDPAHWISLLNAEGREVVCIEDPASLPGPVRDILENELAQREFVPVIERVLRVSSESAPYEWDVETDRGRVQFTLNSDDDVRRLGPQSALIIDAHGIRYLVRDFRTLDAASQRTFERYL